MTTYQGWKNHPTWLVWVWIENDAGLYEHCQELKAESQDVREIADNLKQLIEEAKPELEGIFSDLIDSALAEVSWREIAINLLQD